jgi:hypothetical protein
MRRKLVPPSKKTAPAPVVKTGREWLKAHANVSKPVAAPVVKAPAPTVRKRKRPMSGPDGHTVMKLGDPIRADKLKVGMRVHYGGDFVKVARISPCNIPGLDLIVIEFREHPTRDAFTTCAHPHDPFFTKLIESYTETG